MLHQSLTDNAGSNGWLEERNCYRQEGQREEETLKGLQPKAFRHFVVEEPFPRAIGLHPLAVDHKLWDGTLSRAPHDFVGGAWGGLDIDFFEGNVVVVQKPLGNAAVRAPVGCVDDQFHLAIRVRF